MQARPLDAVYLIVYLDCLVVKAPRQTSHQQSHLLSVRREYRRPQRAAGIWISENEGAKFWLNVLIVVPPWSLSRLQKILDANHCLIITKAKSFLVAF